MNWFTWTNDDGEKTTVNLNLIASIVWEKDKAIIQWGRDGLAKHVEGEKNINEFCKALGWTHDEEGKPR